MTVALDNPVWTQAGSDNLGICGYDIEWQVNLAGVQLCDEIEKSFANSDSLIVRQYYEAPNTEIMRSHVNPLDSYESNWLSVIVSCISTGCAADGASQIMILPKNLPQCWSTFMDFELNFWVTWFFFTNSILSVQKTQSGSSQSIIS